jgi:hypothetical protein
MKHIMVGVRSFFDYKTHVYRATFRTGQNINVTLADLIHDSILMDRHGDTASGGKLYPRDGSPIDLERGWRDPLPSDAFYDCLDDIVDLEWIVTRRDGDLFLPVGTIVIDLPDERVTFGVHSVSFADYVARYSSAPDDDTPAFPCLEYVEWTDGYWQWCWLSPDERLAADPDPWTVPGV